ncbi:MAG: histidine triad family protein [Actinomycetota bacterium]|jgi:histidine triad (HIT) family protein|nr:histidine triad family protein [Actinomycetota bacterium]
MTEDCLFCKIVAGELEADVIAESGTVLAFRDIAPVAPTHILLIPKRHISSASELGPEDGELLAETFGLIKRLAADEGVETGHRVVTNIGPEAGQSVDHLHFHLIGGRPMSWPPG